MCTYIWRQMFSLEHSICPKQSSKAASSLSQSFEHESYINPFDPSRYYSAVWKQSPLLAVWDKTSASSQQESRLYSCDEGRYMYIREILLTHSSQQTLEGGRGAILHHRFSTCIKIAIHQFFLHIVIRIIKHTCRQWVQA